MGRIDIKFVIILILLLSLFIPLAALVGTSLRLNKKAPTPSGEEEFLPISQTGFLKPSEVVNNKQKYSGQFLEARGRVVREQAICTKQACSKEDSCCGCPEEADLIFVDTNSTLLSDKSRNLLKLLDSEKGSLCQRVVGSCGYDCQDWQEGKIYEINGTLTSDFYFLVRDKAPIGSLTSLDQVKNFGQDMLDYVRRLFGGSEYYFR